jgi:hypothetical protein
MSADVHLTSGLPVTRLAKEPRAPGGDDDGRQGTAIITRTKTRTKRPNLYRVLLLNDDYTYGVRHSRPRALF